MTELELKVRTAVKDEDKETLDSAILEIISTKDNLIYLNILNELLLVPFHYHHQEIARILQHIRSPKSIPYIREVFEKGLDYLDYNYSGFGSIAKWFSWTLYSIGTKEAIDLMKEQSNSNDEEIRQEMRYRLSKLH